MKKKHQFYPFFLFAMIVVLGISVTAKFANFFNPSPLPYQEIDSFLKRNQFQGSVLIAKEGNTLFSQGYGYANEEYHIPNTKQTVFRIGSITKQFTAVALCAVAEKKGYAKCPRSPSRKYLPDYPQGNKITIHHLLSHTSGIPSITDFPHLQEIQRHPSTPSQVIAYFKDLPLEFTPGSNCKYSDSGYIILGALIESITKQPFETYIQNNLFQPLRMHSTYYDS